jgi:hypothetical protein
LGLLVEAERSKRVFGCGFGVFSVGQDHHRDAVGGTAVLVVDRGDSFRAQGCVFAPRLSR